MAEYGRAIKNSALVVLLFISECKLLERRALFKIDSADRLIKSASLKLCDQTYSLKLRDHHWQKSFYPQASCKGSLFVNMRDGSRVLCQTGLVGIGDGTERHFDIRGQQCITAFFYHLPANGG